MIEEEYQCNSLLNFDGENIFLAISLLSNVSIQFPCVSDNYIFTASNFHKIPGDILSIRVVSLAGMVG
jgi:hypothetical protein